MRRLILSFFVFLLLGIVLALVFRDQSGYVLIAFAGWQLETSLLFAGAVLLVAIWLLITLWRLLVAGALLPRTTRRWRAQRRSRKARRSLYSGLLRFAEGRWTRAESELERLAERHESPGINYLYAARAAQRQGRVADRDRYLERAAAARDVSELAVLLTQAQLQIEQGQNAEALASLARLYELQPQHPVVLQLYGEQCDRSGDYAQLRVLAPALYKHSNLAAERVDALVVEAWADALKRAGTDRKALANTWKKAPKRLRARPDMVALYAGCLRRAGAVEQAAELIRGALKRNWNASLVLIFGQLKTQDHTAQLASIENWLKQYGEEPELLLVAGRLCLRNRLWGRARSYFEASLKNQSRPDALLELGRLFEEIDQPDDARAAYRQGLELRTGG